MYVCICNAVTDKQIRKAARAGINSLSELQRELGVATGCGSCGDQAAEILRESRRTARTLEPVVYTPALA